MKHFDKKWTYRLFRKRPEYWAEGKIDIRSIVVAHGQVSRNKYVAASNSLENKSGAGTARYFRRRFGTRPDSSFSYWNDHLPRDLLHSSHFIFWSIFKPKCQIFGSFVMEKFRWYWETLSWVMRTHHVTVHAVHDIGGSLVASLLINS